MRVDRFSGEICGVGTGSGVRVVVGRWETSPFGSFCDAMIEDPAGHRVLVAPDGPTAAYISSIYSFDEIVTSPTTCRRDADRLCFDGGGLTIDVAVGGRDALGWVLRAVPRSLATSAAWAAILDPLARLFLGGVRTKGGTPDATEIYAATDRHRVNRVNGTWRDTELGDLRNVEPPVRFGFSSTPRTPSIVEVTTTVRHTAG